MTTQLLINPLLTMGDNHTPCNLPKIDSPPLLGLPLGTRGASHASPASQRHSSIIAETAGTLESILTTAAASQEQQRKQRGDTISSATSLVSHANFNAAPASAFAASAMSNNPSTSHPPGETGIVSLLRNSTSARQHIESALRSKGFADMEGGLNLRKASTPSASMWNHGAAAAAGNQYAALLLQEQMSREMTLTQLAMAGNATAFGMLPTPSSFLTSRLGMGNFGSSINNNAGGGGVSGSGGGHDKSGTTLDPRFMQMVAAAAAAGSNAPTRIKRGPITLFMQCDADSLSEYQCLIRQQIELFEADESEAASSVQGRNKQIVEGQVGIRCRHCAPVPPRNRQKGSMYFPTKLDRIYQAAQNLSAFHLCESCKHVPDDVRKKILLLRERKSPAGGGKRYWGEGVRCLGVVEDSNGLRLR